MKRNHFYILIISIITVASFFFFTKKANNSNAIFISYTADLKKDNLKFYFKNDSGYNFKSIQNLKTWLEKDNQTLVFAMNGGMYKPDNSPQGLFIEDHKLITLLDTATGEGNFYLKPNGVFYITTDNIPLVSTTECFIYNEKIKYATQSGPMLVIDGKINPAFKQGSSNVNIRNGVGILPDNKIIFAMSKKEINFYNFAHYFKQLGCKNALYLDGLVSRMYLPEKDWIQTDGNFGVIIGIVK